MSRLGPEELSLSLRLGQPSRFFVQLQEMRFELLKPREALRTVSAYVRFGAGVNANVSYQLHVRLEQLSAVVTLVRPSGAVSVKSVRLQVAGIAETLATQRAFVRFLSHVDSHVSVQVSGLAERLLAEVTFVRFLSAVDSAVSNEMRRCRESFSTDAAFKRSFFRVSSPVHCQQLTVLETLSALVAPVFSAVNIHMPPQVTRVGKTSVALSTRMYTFRRAPAFTAMNIHVSSQVTRIGKTFLALRTRVHLSGSAPVFTIAIIRMPLQVTWTRKTFPTLST